MPFFWITTLFITGILLASSIGWDAWIWLAGAVLSMFLSGGLLVLSRKGWLRIHSVIIDNCLPNTRLPFLLLPVFLLLGGTAYQFALPDPNGTTIYSFNNQGVPIEIRGTVVELPDVREKLTLVELRADSFRIGSDGFHPTHERLMVFLSPEYETSYGDRLMIKGKPITPRQSADFSYRDFLASQGIFTQMLYPAVEEQIPSAGGIADSLFRFKAKSLNLVDTIFPAPEASLVKGILLGDDDDIPEDLAENFRRSGTSHLIAISGFNIAIVANLITLLFAGLFGKWKGALGAMAAIAVYTILVGANPPVVRAAIMGSIGIIGTLIGRRNGGINALFLTCGLMLLLNPFLLWSISFQLSAGATLGLVLYASPIQKWVEEVIARWSEGAVAKKAGKYLSEYVFFTIAAQVPILPILLHYFHQVPMATLVANPLVLPIQPPLMILSAVALGLAWIHPALGSLAANLSLPLITLTIKVVEWAGQLDLPSLTSPALSFGLIGIWLLVITLPAAIPKLAESVKLKWRPAFLVVMTGFVSLSLIHYAVDRPDGHLHLFLSGGSPVPAILFRTPDGQSILLDTGGSVNELLAFIDARVPFPSRRLDAAILLPGKNRAAVMDAVLPVIQIDRVYILDEVSLSEPGFDDIRQKTNVIDIPLGGSFTTESGVDFMVQPEGDSLQRMQIRWKGLSTDVLVGKSKSPIACLAGIMVLIGQEMFPEDNCKAQLVLTSGGGANQPHWIDLSRTGWVHLTSDGSNFWLESQR